MERSVLSWIRPVERYTIPRRTRDGGVVAGSGRWREAWRAIAYTFVIALALVLLQRGEIKFVDWLTGFDWVVNSGIVDRHSSEALTEEAARVAEASRAALERLPAATRRGVFRLGYGLGYAAQLSGSQLMSTPDAQERVRPIVERRLAASRDLANAMNLGDVAMLQVSSLAEFG